jgi:hypothetical protein
VAEHLKSIRKKNDVKNAEEQKHNKEIAAIERVKFTFRFLKPTLI